MAETSSSSDTSFNSNIMTLSSRLKVILGTGNFRRRGFLEEKEVSALQLLRLRT